MKRVGLIGCGAIGTVLAESIERKLVVCDELVVFDMDTTKAMKLKAKLTFPIKIVANVNDLLASQPKVIVEAASQQAVVENYSKLLQANVDFIIMSTGALLDLDTSSCRLHFSSEQSVA
jgi:aspartate dehydrogenase